MFKKQEHVFTICTYALSIPHTQPVAYTHRGNVARSLELYEKAIQFSRNPFEMSQAYLAEKISAIQAQVCDEYGIKISTLSSGNPFSMSGP